MKTFRLSIKHYFRWIIFGATLFFILHTLKTHWKQVAQVHLDKQGWFLLLLALGVTFIAHVWAGWVWTWILKMFAQPLKPWYAIRVYLQTNLAKYLPGNVWHFYGRIVAVTESGGSFSLASLSVLLEPLLMATAALLISLISFQLGWLNKSFYSFQLAFVGLGVVLLGIHPLILNPVLNYLRRLKSKGGDFAPVNLTQYPWLPLLGELGFLGLRSGGFILTLMGLMTIPPSQIPQLISIFSFAWLLGLIVPGAPGGLGVFEGVMIALVDKQSFPVAIILTAVAFYRVISILAEVLAGAISYQWRSP